MTSQLKIISQNDLAEILGVSLDTLYKMKLPRCPIFPGSRKIFYRLEDVDEHFKKMRQEADDDIDFGLD